MLVNGTAAAITPAPGTASNSTVYKFTGIQTAKAILFAGANGRVTNITVKARKPQFTIVADPENVTLRTSDGKNTLDLSTVFKIDDLKFGGDPADYTLTYSVNPTSKARISGKTLTAIAEGDAVVTATYTTNANSIYGTTTGEFNLHVTGLTILTMNNVPATVELDLVGDNTSKELLEDVTFTYEDDKSVDVPVSALLFTPDPTGIVSVENGVINVVPGKAGSTKVTITYKGTNYKMTPVVVNVTVKDNRPTPVITFEGLTSSGKMIVLDPEAAFTAPTGTATGYTLSWSAEPSDSPVITGFSTETGSYTLTKKYGSVVITASVAETIKNLDASASYTLVVANPLGELQLDPAAQGLKPGSIEKSLTDAADLVSFKFTKTSSNTAGSVSYANGGTVNFKGQNTLTVTSLKDGYYIKDVTFEYSDGSFTKNTVTVTDGTTFDDGKWSFASKNFTTGELTNIGSDVMLTNIYVTLRRAILNLNPIETTVYKKYNSEAYPVADNIKATDVDGNGVNGLTYTFTSEGALSIVDNKVTPGSATSTTTIKASFAGNDKYEPAETSYVFEVTLGNPVQITISDEMPKTLNLYPAGTIDVLDYITTDPIEIKDELKVSSADSTVSVNGTEITATTPGEATINVTYTPAEGSKNAAATASFKVTVVDNRQKLTLQFNPTTSTYNEKNSGTAFVAPTLSGNGSLTVKDLSWASSDESVATVNEEGVVTFKSFDGVKDVTISATVKPENQEYTSNEASYTVTVVGNAIMVGTEGALATKNVNVRGYIVANAKGKMTIAPTDDPSATDAVAVLTGTFSATYDPANAGDLIGRQIIVYGPYNSTKNEVTMNWAMLLKTPEFKISADLIKEGDFKDYYGVPANHATVAIQLPAGYNVENLDIKIDPELPEGSIVGNRITFPDAKSGTTYTVTVKSEEDLPYVSTMDTKGAIFPVAIVASIPGTRQRFVYAQGPNDNGEYETPYIFIQSQNGRVYTVNKSFEPQAQMMTIMPGEFLGFDLQLYYYDCMIYDVDMYDGYGKTGETPQAVAKKRAPVYEGGSALDKEVVTPGMATAVTTPATDLNVYFGPSDMTEGGVFKASKADTEILSAPVGERVVYAQEGRATSILTLWYKASDGSWVRLTDLKNDENTLTPNLYQGKFTTTGLPDNLEMIVSSENVNGQPAGTIMGATVEGDGEALAAGILEYENDPNVLTWDQIKKEIAGMSEAEVNAWYDKYLSDIAASAAKAQTEMENDGTGLAAANSENTDTVDLTLTDALKAKMEDKTLYVNFEYRHAVTVDEEGNTLPEDEQKPAYYVIGFGTNTGNIATAVNEIESADDADVMWFTLQGERIAEPSEGIVIRVQGNKSEKILIRK